MEQLFLDIARTKALPELWRLMISYFHSKGFEGVSYYVPKTQFGANHADMIVIEHGFPADWVDKYLRGGQQQFDAVPRFAMARGTAFRWSEIGNLLMMDEDELRFQNLVREAGITDGFALPVFGPHGRNAYVGIGMVTNDDALDKRNMPELQMAAQGAHLKICALTPEMAALEKPLSQREREILEWVAKGKSNGVIAEILSLSTGTVDTYLRRIYNKLDVSDRTSAAVKGVGMGLIALG